ncbi:MAG: hypothetical protein WCE44_03860 [Candidatus Velthaea sp.]
MAEAATKKKIDIRAGEIRFIDPADILIEEGFNLRDFTTKEMNWKAG